MVSCPGDTIYTYFNLSKAGMGLRQGIDGHDLASLHLIFTNSSVKEKETYRFLKLSSPTIQDFENCYTCYTFHPTPGVKYLCNVMQTT